MRGRHLDTFHSRPLLVLGTALLLGAGHASAAPRIIDVMSSAPPHAQVGAKVLFAAEGLVAPVHV